MKTIQQWRDEEISRYVDTFSKDHVLEINGNVVMSKGRFTVDVSYPGKCTAIIFSHGSKRYLNGPSEEIFNTIKNYVGEGGGRGSSIMVNGKLVRLTEKIGYLGGLYMDELWKLLEELSATHVITVTNNGRSVVIGRDNYEVTMVPDLSGGYNISWTDEQHAANLSEAVKILAETLT